MSPSSSSSRMAADCAVIVGGGGGGGGVDASPQRPVRRVIQAADDFPAVDDLISKLPDVLFPFEGDTGDDELTPFKAVYGSSPGGGGGGGRFSHSQKGSRYNNDDGGNYGGGFNGSRGGRGHGGGYGGNSPKAHLCFGSAPAGDGENTFGGRRGSHPMSASPPMDRQQRNSVSGGGKYEPPNRRGSDGSLPFGSPPHSQPRYSRGKQGGGNNGNNHNNNKAVKKNPVTPGFNGAGFRSIREIYVSKVHEFLCARAIEGVPWVKLSGKDGVAVVCEKPLTVPENYTQFFRDHASMFELSPDGRYVAAKVPGEEHACIPPPPAAADSGASSGSPSPSLSSSPAAAAGLLSDELRLQGGFLSFSMPPPSSSPSSVSASQRQGPGPGQQQQHGRGRSGKPERGLLLAVDANAATLGRSQSPGAKSNSSHSSGDSSLKVGSEGSTRSNNSGGGKLCMYLSRPGGCRAGDACRFSHAVSITALGSPPGVFSGKPPKSPSMKIAKKFAGVGVANVALPA
jgi:hypothetical protein